MAARRHVECPANRALSPWALCCPDPALALPAGAILKPAIFLRNASGNAYTQLTFNWRSGTTSGKSVTAVSLQPYATSMVDVAALQAQGTIPASAQWAYVSITAPVKPDELLAVATSYDPTGKLGAQTPFSDQVSNQWEGGKWEVDANHDTLIAVGNAGTSASKARLTFFYNSGQGTYQMEQTLSSDEQLWLDMGNIISNQLPDKNGKTIPSSVTSGTYRLDSLTGKPTEGLFEGKLVVDKTYGYAAHGCMVCCGYWGSAYIVDNPLNLPMQQFNDQSIWGTNNCDYNDYDITSYYTSWSTGNTQIATASMSPIEGVNSRITAVGVGSTTNGGSGLIPSGDGDGGYGIHCPNRNNIVSGPVNVVTLTCPASVTRGGTAQCTVNGPSGTAVSGWKFVDSSNNTVTTNSTSLTWSGVMVTSGTVNATVSGMSNPLTATITVNNRSGFAFTAVNPTQLTGTNSITCYSGTNVTLSSPPQPNSTEGYSCANLAYSFNFATVNDGGPNNGYEYVTSASPTNGNNPTTFQFIVVADLLSATAFYNAQCGNFSQSNQSGFIAGSQLSQNVFDHEQGSVLSHWTEYQTAQNNSSNNIGTVLESTTAPPGSTGNSFAQTAGNAALNRIATAVSVEPCGGSVIQDSSQSCKTCGAVNYSPYQSCGGATPVPYCQ